ncbi:MAG: hypothetical protein R6U00_00335, partial [Prochlorococcaceae cyanobacterium]
MVLRASAWCGGKPDLRTLTSGIPRRLGMVGMDPGDANDEESSDHHGMPDRPGLNHAETRDASDGLRRRAERLAADGSVYKIETIDHGQRVGYAG